MNDMVHEMEKDILLNRMENYLMHYGVGWDENPPGIGSGRYPHGSGENPFQHHTLPTLEDIEEYQKKINPKTGKKYTDAEVAEALKIIGRSGQPSSGTLRAYKNILKTEKSMKEYSEVLRLKEEGYSGPQIAKMMGYNSESSIRNILNEESRIRKNKAMMTADYIQSYVDKNGMYDVGKGVEACDVFNGISRTKFNEALEILELRGYPVYGGGIKQIEQPGHQQTNQLVVCPKGTPHKEIWNFENVHSFADPNIDTKLDKDQNNIRKKFEYPSSLDPKRVQIVYGDEGGVKKDGLVEIRPGLKDCNIGDNHYAQVRILVNGTHYIKGMAVYNDELPKGVDVRFNTNKLSDIEMLGPDKDNSVLKPIGKDKENPFGALIKEDGGQTYYDDPKGKFIDHETGKRQSLNVVNIKSEEGDWKKWKDTLPSQFLAKQPIAMAKRQLKLSADDKVGEFKDYMELNNPTVKRNLLNSFADSCDSAAVNLKAAALPRQKYQVLIPLDDIKDNQVYAPNFKAGEQVALVRFPHASITEIPILTVVNKNHKEGSKVIGKDSIDAIGINSKVAERLSGADFDGDTVLVIPTNNGKTVIKNAPQYPELVGFEPKIEYHKRDGMKYMKDTQKQMGVISNLITDMTIAGASPHDIALAIRHSMVVIDAEKHSLDYKRSEKENEIDRLKKTYQMKPDGTYGGASTLLSKAKGEYDVEKREGARQIDKESGEVSWKTARPEKLYYEDYKHNAAYKKIVGSDEYQHGTKQEQAKLLRDAYNEGILVRETRTRMQKSTNMAETRDANKLISVYDSKIEHVYADYANQMKSLANQARKEAMAAGKIEYNRRAAQEYAPEVAHLMAQLNDANKQAVKERAARRISNVEAKAREEGLRSAGNTQKEIQKEMKKINQQALTNARAEVGAKRVVINISDREWEAIQAGAISDTKLQQILRHADPDRVKELATPRKKNELASWKVSKIKSMNLQGYTNEEIARSLGVSPSTVSNYL